MNADVTPFVADIDSEANLGDDKLRLTLLFELARIVLVLKHRAPFFRPRCGPNHKVRKVFFSEKHFGYDTRL